MSTDRTVLVFAALVILTGTALGVWVNNWFLVMPAFVGLNLLQAQFTRLCPLAKLLDAVGCDRSTLFR